MEVAGGVQQRRRSDGDTVKAKQSKTERKKMLGVLENAMRSSGWHLRAWTSS